jgi:hypothetical protein
MIKKSCLRIGCPERFSLCCHVPCRIESNNTKEHFVCSRCGRSFQGGLCNAGESTANSNQISSKLAVEPREENIDTIKNDGDETPQGWNVVARVGEVMTKEKNEYLVKEIKRLCQEDFTSGVKKGVEEERKSTIEFINKLLKISEVYVPFQKIHYQSALSDLLSELNKQEK